MFIELLIGIATLIIALNGLIYEPKKDPKGPVSWKNINRYGKLLIGLLVLLIALQLTKSFFDQVASSKQNDQIEELLTSQDELQDINQHLIKVMSVADGYNAAIRGMVIFRSTVTENQIRDALRNLFLKYAEIEIQAYNKLGQYEGRIDHASHPEVRKFLRLSDIDEDSEYNRYREMRSENSYFFEIRCSNIKILNQYKIQYARFDPYEKLDVQVRTFSWSRDFNRIYNVAGIYIRDIEIEELDILPIEKYLSF